ncbi:TetR/AcrR family transcriptional regulator [Devosia albogilva]|uniref:TetR/AcrR family transcriptional regulator n=1 Tax=Devosia albogilva TaxID=429726 RepID=A0ABW5QHL1_9HYPH
MMRASQTRRTQEERREESEQRMLAAGVHLVAQHGPEKLTLTEVGKNAGYSRGLPAHHFGSRESYLKALASYVAIEFDKTLPEVNQISGLEAVLEITRAVLDQLEADRTRGLATQIVLADPRRDRALSKDIAELRDNTLALLSRHIADGIRRGEIRATVMPDFASLFIAAGICGLIDSLLADARFNSAAGGKQLLELIENALSAKTNSSSSP